MEKDQANVTVQQEIVILLAEKGSCSQPLGHLKGHSINILLSYNGQKLNFIHFF